MSKRTPIRFVWLLLASALIPSAQVGAGDVNGTLAGDPTRLAGADELGRMLLYTPNPLEVGSSISHWDISAFPDLLMEPSASPRVPIGEVDLTLPHFWDLGWPQGASTITIRVIDGANSGFNDPAPVAVAPGNPGGTTLGGQRLAAMQWAAGIWGASLGSNIEINIESSFREADCDADTGEAVLASAGARFLFFDFPNAPRQAIWYHGALAEALANENLSNTEDGQPPDTGDVVARFNSAIDEGCLGEGFRFYYGLDGNTPTGQVSFAMVALHEMAHGLGFSDFLDIETGSLPSFPGLSRMPDIYTVFTYDKDLELHWNVMSDAERQASAVNTGRVVWDGPLTTDATFDFLGSPPLFTINRPRLFAEDLAVQGATFGPLYDPAGVTGDLVMVDDGSGEPTLGCNGLVNAQEVAGKIAIVDRGECFFTVKVKNAQNAGAVAVVVVNNLADGLPPMGGDDPTITIPSVGISQADGELIKRVLEASRIRHRRPIARVSPAGVGGR
jgi:hypothetical protein